MDSRNDVGLVSRSATEDDTKMDGNVSEKPLSNRCVQEELVDDQS